MVSDQAARPDGLSENLARFRYHTGGRPTPLAEDEPCPLLFRDVGPGAMARFLSGELRQLCGPVSPITYLRTADYREPYTDYGRIGRIVLLQPRRATPWRAGIETVFIASRRTPVDADTMVFVPADVPLADAAARLAGARCREDVADLFGRSQYEEAARETLARIDRLQRTLAETEPSASRLRRLFQSAELRQRDSAREWMRRRSISESDLCTAWHHLPEERRRFLRETLVGENEELPA
ncbi:MAG: hypothetical protein RIC55_03550 [Pirellulaceae bacterium]